MSVDRRSTILTGGLGFLNARVLHPPWQSGWRLGLLDAHSRHCVIDGRAEGSPEELTDALMAAVGRLMRRG